MNLFRTPEVPEERFERIKKLECAIKTLKDEFVGLDDIIDQISDNIYSWYITPEVITRPTIVSIWGMTGTGKTSIVKRLIELLGLSDIFVTLDCGSCRSEVNSFVDKLTSTFDDGKIDETLSRSVFLFDEFQYANTIDEDGKVESIPNLRPVWSILDSGTVDLINNYNYNFFSLVEFIDQLEVLVEQYPDIIIEDNKVVPEDYDRFMEYMSYYYTVDDESRLGNVERVSVLNCRLTKCLSMLNRLEPKLGLKTLEYLTRTRLSVAEFFGRLREVKILLGEKNKVLDCSKSLIFAVGNLDEAFKVSSEISPDLDADMFNSITSKVTTTDIKNVLRKKFKSEQIGRLGNNIIKYPTLKSEDFRKIIDLEIQKGLKRFTEVDPIRINFTDAFKDLLYSESVYPTQGVRPILTSISTLLTPYLSKVLIYKGESDEVTIDVESERSDFKVPSVEVVLRFNKSKEVRLKQDLELGKERCPENRKKRYITAVHEIGHAIMFAYCKGDVPINIVSVATGGGGFCTSYDSRFDGEIPSREDLVDDVLISLGGYVAERIVFKKEGKQLLGSSDDIRSTWEALTKAIMKSGYYFPVPIAHRESESSGQISEGIGSSVLLDSGKSCDELAKEFIESSIEGVKTIIESELELVKHASLILGDKGAITGDEFREFIVKHGKNLNLESMKKRYEERDEKYYIETLKNL